MSSGPGGDEDSIPPIPESPTPVRINSRNVHLGSDNRKPANSPSGSPKRSRVVYGDRYIPNRSGVNLQAAFNLAKDEVAPVKPRPLNSNSTDLESQRVEEANKKFSTLLKAELFGNDVPSVVPGSSSADASSSANGASRSNSSTPFDPQSSSSTSPRTVKSAPVTPNKNIFKYNSQKLCPNSTGRPWTETSGIRLFRDMMDSQNEMYSLSPIRMESQRLLLSPTKHARTVPSVPYKILDAPELADDFYLNLVDWGSRNVLGVGLGRCVYLWNANTGTVDELCRLKVNDSVTSLAWVNQGVHLAVGTERGEIQIWDAEARRSLRVMTGHESRAGALAWNGYILSSGSRDRSILHRDVRISNHYITRLTGHKQEVCGLKWNRDLNYLASGGNDNKLLVWQGVQDTPLHRFTDHTAAVKAIAWSPHKRGLLASGGGTLDRTIRFWNTITGAAISEVDTGSQVCCLAWSKNSKELVSTHGYSQNQISIWKYPSMQQVAVLTGHTYRVLYLSMSPDGRTIVTGAGDETLRFWNVFEESKSPGSSSVLDVFQQLR